MAWGVGTAGNDKPEWRARREKLLARYSRMSDSALRAEYKRMQAGSPASVALSNKHADLAGYLATEQTDREWWGRPERIRAGRAQSGGRMAEQKAPGDNYESLTVENLKIQLRSHGLPVSGRKADLIARLRGAGGAGPKAPRAPKAPPEPKAAREATGRKRNVGAYKTKGNITRPLVQVNTAKSPRSPAKTKPMRRQATADANWGGPAGRRQVGPPAEPKPRGTPVKTRPVRVGTERRKVEGRMVTRVRQAPATRPIQRGTRPLEASERIRAREGQKAEAERVRSAERTGKRRAPKTKPLSNRFVYTGAKGNPRYRPESPSTRPVYRSSDLSKGQGGHLYVRQAPKTKPGANRVEAQTRQARAVARAEPSTRSRASIASVPPRPLSAAERRKYDALVTQVNRGEVSQTRLIPYQIHAGGERQFRANVRKMNRHGVRQLAEELQEEHGMQGDLDEMSDDTLRARIIGHVKTCRTCRGERG